MPPAAVATPERPSNEATAHVTTNVAVTRSLEERSFLIFVPSYSQIHG
jgi:hypothetical protein